MGDLYWETVKPQLRETLTALMRSEVFQSFRLVGGTSLSLQIGHRMSDDIDLFTDSPYGSVDFSAIDSFLRKEFPYVSGLTTGPLSLGVSYLVGEDRENTVKVDLFHTDTFIRDAIEVGQYRLATVEEIISMKVDIIQRKGRKKDFWDLHELLERYPVPRMIALHKERYSYGHDEKLILKHFTDFSDADEDFDPICLRGKYWELIKIDIIEALNLE